LHAPRVPLSRDYPRGSDFVKSFLYIVFLLFLRLELKNNFVICLLFSVTGRGYRTHGQSCRKKLLSADRDTFLITRLGAGLGWDLWFVFTLK